MDEIQCPLCCGNTFSSKAELIDHISKYENEIQCPICLEKCSSLDVLSQHLVEDNCKILGHKDDDDNEFHITLHFDRERDHTYTQNTNEESTLPLTSALDTLSENNEDSNTPEVGSNFDSEEKEMFVDLLNKPLSETFQMEKMQLMDESGENRYIIVAQNNGIPSITSGVIVANKNLDGTMSIKNVEDEGQAVIENHIGKVPVMDNNISIENEVYTCNSCGFNFTSVLEHIQEFHKNEDVVVEVNEATASAVTGQSSEESEEHPAADPAAPRRVITAAGCIVEREDGDNAESKRDTEPPILGDVADANRLGPLAPPPLASSLKKEHDEEYATVTLTEKSSQKAPYHQVVVKEMVSVGGAEVKAGAGAGAAAGGRKVKVYYCTACHTYVSDLNDFKSQPCKFLKYTCLDCPASYETAKSLYAHMKQHKHAVQAGSPVFPDSVVVTTEGPFRCAVCDTVFTSNKSLKLHKRMHVPTKEKAIEPPVVLQTDGTELTHDEKYLCTLCNKMIPVDYRGVHDYFHDACEKFNCDICNKKFESNDYLVMHMKVHNTDKSPIAPAQQDKSLPYDCAHCPRRFARPHEKVKHERVHTGEKPHSCEICGKSFRVSYCLTLHMRTHTGARPYECTHCGKRFKAHSVYNHHLLTHSDVRAYKCPFCPKAFKTSVQLAGHKNSHTKPFSCKQCNRPFASLYAVRVHTETHRRENNLKYSCSLCGASYARTFALKDHMRQAHRERVEAAESYIYGMETVKLEDKS